MYLDAQQQERNMIDGARENMQQRFKGDYATDIHFLGQILGGKDFPD